MSLLATIARQLKGAVPISSTHVPTISQVRLASKKLPGLYNRLSKPRPEPGEKFLKYTVHYEDEYTVKPLQITKLGGRDPITGRRIHQGWGGGIKHKFHWVQYLRKGPTEPDVPPIEEKVIQIVFDGNRTARLALVAGADQMKYYIATVNMKPGDILRTSSYIPPIPVTPNEGDAYPLGALAVGTLIHNVQVTPNQEQTQLRAAGVYGTIIKQTDKHSIVKMPNKFELSFDRRCMACVGRVGNVDHATTPIGSAQKWRQLGFRPRSGLWQRKTGRFGRKIRAPKKYVVKDPPEKVARINLDEY